MIRSLRTRRRRRPLGRWAEVLWRGPRPLVAVPGAVLALVLVAAAGTATLLRIRRPPRVAQAVIGDPEHSLSVNESGATRSVQAADLTLPTEALDRIWTPMYLERLARTYWRFITRATLGIVRVRYTARGREVVLLAPQLRMLTFHRPEYEVDANHGVVRWRIARGLLVSRAGRGQGYLQIDVRRQPDGEREDSAVVHVEVEVANFYPSIASGLGQWLYRETQSRIHVLVTHGFLRSLARLDLAESVIGRFAQAVADSESTGPGPVPGRAWRPVQRVAERVAASRDDGEELRNAAASDRPESSGAARPSAAA